MYNAPPSLSLQPLPKPHFLQLSCSEVILKATFKLKKEHSAQITYQEKSP